MATATFNGQALGDALLAFSSGNIDRAVVEQQLFGQDGHAARNRGGGKQTISVTCYRQCATTLARATYVQDLWNAHGNAKATLALSLADGTQQWTECLCTGIREDETAGPYVRFTLTFLRSVT
jgi:hypothetical protein